MGKRLRSLGFIFMPTICFFTIACSVNILQEFGKTDSDQARYHEAVALISKSQFSEAVTVIEGMTDAYKQKSFVLELHASAYAGLCGLDFLTMADDIKNIGTTNLYTLLMIGNVGATDQHIADCAQASTLIKTIGATGATRSDDQNLFLATVAFQHMGVILNRFADTNDDSNRDAGFDACATLSMPDTNADSFGAALMTAVESIGAISNPAFGSEQLSDINSVCASMVSISSPDVCTKTSGGFTATELKAVRSTIKESNAVGLGQCTGDLSTCNCP